MRHVIVIGLCISIMGLTSCAAYQAQSQLQKRYMQEDQAWNNANTELLNTCANGMSQEEYKASMSRKNVLKRIECTLNIADTHVAPYVMYPDLFYELKADIMRTAEKYHTGKISKTEYRAQGNELMAKYMSDIHSRANTMIAQAQAKDQKFNDNFNRGFYGTMQAQQAMRQQQSAQSQQILNSLMSSDDGMHSFTYKCKDSPVMGGITQCQTW